MARRIIAIPAFEDEAQVHCVPLFVKAMVEPHNLELVPESRFKSQPELLDRVAGILAHPGFCFYKVENMEKLKSLKVVSTCSAGYNHLDLEYLKKRNIRVGYTPATTNDAVADAALGLIIATARKFKSGIELAMKKESGKLFPNTTAYFGHEVTGKTLGIVGMGHIGLEVAKRAAGFRMKVLYHNRSRRPDDSSVNATYVPTLDELLPLCDFVVITCALTDETKHLFGPKQFQLMKNTANIINVSRGPVVDNLALAKALKQGDIGAAGLDVTDPEPLPETHPLLDLDNVTILPHLGSQTFETRKVMWQMAVDNLTAGLNNQAMPAEL